MKKLSLVFGLVAVMALLGACAQYQAAGLSVNPATPTECPNGGTEVWVNGNLNTVCNGAPGAPATPVAAPSQDFQPGLSCTVYSILASDYAGTVNWNKLFTDGTIMFTQIVTQINTPNQADTTPLSGFTAAQLADTGTTNYALDCSGFLYAPVTGTYTFTLNSDDGSQLDFGNQVLIDMPQAQAMSSKSVTLTVYAGYQPINVFYFQGPATNDGFQLSWQGPANAGLGTQSIIPAANLFH